MRIFFFFSDKGFQKSFPQSEEYRVRERIIDEETKKNCLCLSLLHKKKKCLPHATRLVKCCVENTFPLALFKREKNSLWLTKTRSFETTRMTCFSLELSSTRSSYFQSLKKNILFLTKRILFDLPVKFDSSEMALANCPHSPHNTIYSVCSERLYTRGLV